MTHKLILSTAIALALASAAAKSEDFSDRISVRGFGTVGVAHATVEGADVVGNAFMTDGAGHTREWDARTDSRFATQANIAFTDKLSFTVQALSQYRYDHSFMPQIEWANLKYSFTPNFYARIGRIALPTYMVSDSRLVGYANTWVRPPEEVYRLSSITNNDGVDLSYVFSAGSLRNSMQAFYGTYESKMADGKTKAESIWGANYLIESGAAAFRASYIRMNLTLESKQLNQLIGGFAQFAGFAGGFGLSSQAAQANALVAKYAVEDMGLSFLSVGAMYDTGPWFASAELIDFGGDSVISDARSGYVMGGARFGKFTPYAIVAKVKGEVEAESGISTTGLGPLASGAATLNAGINQMLSQIQGSQESAAIGLRWDAWNNIALKAQYNYVELGENSAGKLGNIQPGFERGGNYSLYSLTVDYIF